MERTWWDEHPEYTWIDEYCASRVAAAREYKDEWEAWRYLVGEKMFAMVGYNKEEVAILTVKLDPVFGQSLRQEYPDAVFPGYYMNKVHWNSIAIEAIGSSIDEGLVKEMIDQSHELILSSLPKKTREALTGC